MVSFTFFIALFDWKCLNLSTFASSLDMSYLNDNLSNFFTWFSGDYSTEWKIFSKWDFFHSNLICWSKCTCQCTSKPQGCYKLSYFRQLSIHWMVLLNFQSNIKILWYSYFGYFSFNNSTTLLFWLKK